MEQVAADRPVSLATGSDGPVQSSQRGPQGPTASTAATEDAAADCSNQQHEAGGEKKPGAGSGSGSVGCQDLHGTTD